MSYRGFWRALFLFLLPVARVSAGDVDQWSDAPPEWVTGINAAAFCAPGEWYFDTEGDRSTTTGTEKVAVTGIFFEDSFGRARHWSSDVHVDEMTALRIARDDAGNVTIEALAGKTVAAARNYAPVTVSGLFRKVTATTKCQPDEALMIELWADVDELGITDVLKASLALGQDGALIARLGRYTCWLCVRKNRTHSYVRFPAGITPSR